MTTKVKGSVLYPKDSKLPISFGTLAELKAYNTAKATHAILLGNTVSGDSLGGIYEYDAASTSTPDNDAVVQPDSGGGRWLKKKTLSAAGAAATTTAAVSHTSAYSGAVTRTSRVKHDEFVSLADFGGVGDNTTDNATAFASAQSSAAEWIYIPHGTYYTTGNANTLTKHYWGPGKIRTAFDNAPGRFTWITSRPATGTGVDVARFFSGDLSKVDASYTVLGTGSVNVRKALTEPYFESVTTPKFDVMACYSGWSGTSAKLSAPASAGATVVSVTSTNGFSVGHVVGFNDTNDNITDTRTITAVGASTLTLNSGLSSSYITGSRITHGTRTMNPLQYQQVTHNGGGDAYCTMARMIMGYTPIAGQEHVFYTSTGGLFGGDLSTSTSGTFMTGIEIAHNDLGNDSAAIGCILNFNRSNATGNRGAFWSGVLVKSEGTQAMNSGYVAIGKMNVGLDLAKGDFGTSKCAIGLKEGDRIYFDNSATLMGDYSLVGNVIGDTYLGYDAVGLKMQGYVNNGLAFNYTSTYFEAGNDLGCQNNMYIAEGKKLLIDGRLGDSYLGYEQASNALRVDINGATVLRAHPTYFTVAGSLNASGDITTTANNRFMFEGPSGDTYLKYNSSSSRLETWLNGAAVCEVTAAKTLFNNNIAVQEGAQVQFNSAATAYITFSGGAFNKYTFFAASAPIFAVDAAGISIAGKMVVGTDVVMPTHGRVMLEGESGDTYLKYNGSQIELVKNGVVVQSW